MELNDVAKLEQELQGIYQERQVVNERLKAFNPGRGRGRGSGPFGPGSFRGAPLAGRGIPGRGALPGQYNYGPVTNDFPGPPHVDRGSDRSNRYDRYPSRSLTDSTRPSVMDRLGSMPSRDDRRPARAAEPTLSETVSAVEPAGTRKRLLSAVVVDGETKQLSQTDELMTAKRPKADDTDDNPAAKKRNRRMFGFLNQTLQKSKDESSEFRKSRVAQQRDEALQRAEERRREELVKFKASFKLEMATKRHTEVNLKKQLNMQADIKRAEIMLLQRVLRRKLMTNFIQTKAGPPLCWLPGKQNAVTQGLLQKEQEKLEAFKLEEAAKVEAKRLEIADRVAAMAKEVEAAAARRLTDSEAALQRRSAATAAAASGAPPADAADPAQAEAADEEMAAEDDEAEDGALEDAEYAVGEEEVMPDANPSAEQEAALQRDLEANGSAQPDSAEDDRYVAVAYSEGEDQDDRVQGASAPQESAQPSVTDGNALAASQQAQQAEVQVSEQATDASKDQDVQPNSEPVRLSTSSPKESMQPNATVLTEAQVVPDVTLPVQ